MPRHCCHHALYSSLLWFSCCAAATQETAVEGASNILACAGLENDIARLACYDQAAARALPAPERADAIAQEARQTGTAAQVMDGVDTQALRPRAILRLFAHEPEDSNRDALANAGRGSLLDRRWELAKDSKLGTFNLRAYKPIYLLPAFWSSHNNQTPYSPNPRNSVVTPQQLDAIEAKFQLGFKTKLAENLFGHNGDLWFGYTQSSRWQVYNDDISRPFRETNYEPEALLVFRNGYRLGTWRGRMLAVGITHQSNGRSDPLSRSWNRLMFNIGLDREHWALMLRPWVRINDPADDDDNPDISDYLGRADITLTRLHGRHEFSLMARHSLRPGARSHGALQLDWGFPIHRHFRGHVQLFNGYGESMIDYNHKTTSIGIGVSLMEWFQIYLC